MKRLISFIMLAALTFSLFGCKSISFSKEPDVDLDTAMGITGYVMMKDSDRILVISQEAQDFSANGGVKEYYDAIWFSNAPKEIKLGDEVKVWYDFVRESYPGQSEVKKIEVMPGVQAVGGDLTSTEALFKALTTGEIDSKLILAVNSIGYDKQADMWNIQLKDITEDKAYHIQVEDK